MGHDIDDTKNIVKVTKKLVDLSCHKKYLLVIEHGADNTTLHGAEQRSA